jgi:PAS domain-containing protein
MSKDWSVRSFVVANAIMAAAVAARIALDPALPGLPPFITLYPAITLAGLLCGPFAGAVAAVLGAATAVFFWIPPRMSFATPNLTDSVAVALFLTFSSIVLWGAAAIRAHVDASRIANVALELGLAAGGVGTWEINLRTLRITASKVAHALHGLPEDTPNTSPEDWMRGVHPDDVAKARAALRAAVADGGLASYAYRISLGPDSDRWITARGRVVASGGERRLLCALVDISDQIRAQDELKRERERLRLALEAGALAVWDFDARSGEATVDIRYAATMGLGPEAGLRIEVNGLGR